MTRLTVPEDAARTVSYFEFEARRHDLEGCGVQLAGQPSPEMETFKPRVLQQGDGLTPDLFAAWLASTALGEWKLGVCKQCPSTDRTDGTCRLWDEVVAPYFTELAEIRRRVATEKLHTAL